MQEGKQNKKYDQIPQINYAEQCARLTEFLCAFQEKTITPHPDGLLKYQLQMQRIANGEQKSLDIHMEDLEHYFSGENEEILLYLIKHNVVRYVELFKEAAEQVWPSRDIDLEDQQYYENLEEIINQQRQENLNPAEGEQLPLALRRQLEVYIVQGPNGKQSLGSLRELRCDQLGGLVCVKAQVVRVGEVKPQIVVQVYQCDVCGYEVYQTVGNKTYTPLSDCSSPKCKQNRTRGKLVQNNAASKFVAYQDLRVQETPEQVPIGSIPRVFRVVAKGEVTRQCAPGDVVTIQGVFLPTEFEKRFKGNQLLHDTYVQAFQIQKQKKRYADMTADKSTEEAIEELLNMGDEVLYNRLAQSIAPEIYGLEDVKKALLLLMLGGVTMNMKDGMKIRGDINIAMIGDPGVAKSQLLKHIAHISPRAVYTTGKGSSGVGLTACVTKDPVTNELQLEGGALVLADMGVCCIDEFDKMEDTDRTAIYEVMEQQSVSIAKAGITTILNARTSILAAANPYYGRYNRDKTPHENINLPAALLSRFDLVFILLDQIQEAQDLNMARHIGYVHQTGRAFKTEATPIDSKVLRAFISKAKSIEPKIDQELHKFMVQRYVEKRKMFLDTTKTGYSYTTPRTLLAIIRLSQALARIRMSPLVNQADVDEALRLMEVCQAQVQKRDVQQDNGDNHNLEIFTIIKQMCNNRESQVNMKQLEKKIIEKGYLLSELMKTIQMYKGLSQLMENGDYLTHVQ